MSVHNPELSTVVVAKDSGVDHYYNRFDKIIEFIKDKPYMYDSKFCFSFERRAGLKKLGLSINMTERQVELKIKYLKYKHSTQRRLIGNNKTPQKTWLWYDLCDFLTPKVLQKENTNSVLEFNGKIHQDIAQKRYLKIKTVESLNNSIVINKTSPEIEKSDHLDNQTDSSPQNKNFKRKLKILGTRWRRQELINKSLRKSLLSNSRKIRILQKRLQQKNNKELITEENVKLLMDSSGINNDLITRQILKLKKQPLPKKYSTELKLFAINLNSYSPEAYEYVREAFNNCLPNPRQINDWNFLDD